MRALQRIDHNLPFLKYLGFSFWVAWFGASYSSSVWITSSEVNIEVVTEMFVVSTLAHVAALGLCALGYRRLATVLRKPAVVLALALMAAVGCALIVAAGPSYLFSHPLFIAGSLLTGIGTGALCVNGGMLLCSLKPDELLKTLLVCELAASLIGCLTASLPSPLAIAAYTALPLLSAACFAVGSSHEEAPGASERDLLAPTPEFGRFLAAVFVLGVTARIAQGFFSSQTTPFQLGHDGSLVTLATIVALGALLVVSAASRRHLGFGAIFYTSAGVIAASLALCALVPGGSSAGVIVSGTAFQMFDVATWFACGYIVYQSKSSGLLLVTCARMVISLGVTVGTSVGSLAADALGGDTLPVALTAALLLADALAVGAVFPPRRIAQLLLPIPDEDEPDMEAKTEAEAEAIGAQESAGAGMPALTESAAEDGMGHGARDSAGRGAGDSAESGAGGEADGVHLSRWKTLCLALADEAGLTEREKEVFVLLAKGRGSQSISDALTVSLYTTRAHTRNIYVKLGVHSRHELSERVQEYVAAHP